MTASSVKPYTEQRVSGMLGTAHTTALVHKDCLRSRMPGRAISAHISADVEGEVLYCGRADPVSLPPPASSCPPLYLGQLPLWQPLLSSTATSSRKISLTLPVESSLAHSCFSIALGGF